MTHIPVCFLFLAGRKIKYRIAEGRPVDKYPAQQAQDRPQTAQQQGRQGRVQGRPAQAHTEAHSRPADTAGRTALHRGRLDCPGRRQQLPWVGMEAQH
jgi:hypothetical protein